MTDARARSSTAAGVSPPRRAGRASAAGNATEKVLNLLEAVAAHDGPARLGDIAAAAGVPKASAHRILQTLVGKGFLRADGTGGYGAGPRLRTLAAQVSAGTAAGGVDEALRELQRTTGHTVHLALRAGDALIYTHKVEGTQAVQMASRVGMRMPLHATAIGKCVLASLPPAELDQLVARTGLPAKTPTTLSTKDDLVAALERVRADGFAVDDEENEPRIRCLAAPVRDGAGAVIGGVSVSTVTFLVPRADLLAWAPAIQEAAATISRRMP